MPTPSGSLTAVVVSGGKQYRVAVGDRILVDRLPAEAGTELTLRRVLMVADGSTTTVAPQELTGQSVTARVVRHARGPKVDVLRYKPKKRVRVHRGARADLTALEILSIGAVKSDEKPARRTRSARRASEPAEEAPAQDAP